MLSVVRKFLVWPWEKKKMWLEAFACLGWARLLKALPFSWIAPSLGAVMTETPTIRRPEDEKRIGMIARAIQSASRRTPWKSQCLVRAIAAQKMLERRRIGSTLYLGTAKDASGNMIAHAWLRTGPHYITGAEEMAGFTTVAAFGKDIK